MRRPRLTQGCSAKRKEGRKEGREERRKEGRNKFALNLHGTVSTSY